MKLNIIDHSFHYEMEKLTRIFFPSYDIKVVHEKDETGDYVTTGRIKNGETNIIYVRARIGNREKELRAELDGEDVSDGVCERRLAQLLFSVLSEITEYTPPWGILTGVRPSKLMCAKINELGKDAAAEYFMNELKVSEEKTRLALTVAENESEIMKKGTDKSFSLYISIPFCPTRCSYCSFVSQANEQAKKLIPQYVEKLCEEIRVTGKLVKDLGLKLESIYYGGGTPTTLSAKQFERVSEEIKSSFDISGCEEYTVEAGRPDSVSADKLAALKNAGATRISINPQTFNDLVLKEIGRRHTSAETLSAFFMARKYGFDNINTDLIAGLPTDTYESFSRTIDKTISLNPESVTVHTLALKRSSQMVTGALETNDAELCRKMLTLASEKLSQAGYVPYYMYRQSRCLGNFENVGWAKKGFECLYNVYMMEECHTVIALGAGAVTKLKNPYGNEIERVYNHKYPYEYIGRFDEIIKRKERITEFYTDILKR